MTCVSKNVHQVNLTTWNFHGTNIALVNRPPTDFPFGFPPVHELKKTNSRLTKRSEDFFYLQSPACTRFLHHDWYSINRLAIYAYLFQEYGIHTSMYMYSPKIKVVLPLLPFFSSSSFGSPEISLSLSQKFMCRSQYQDQGYFFSSTCQSVSFPQLHSLHSLDFSR